MFGAARPAPAAEPFPITASSPADGSVQPTSDFRHSTDFGFNFQIQSPVTGLDYVIVTITRSPEVGADGLLAGEPNVYRMFEYGNSGLYANAYDEGASSLDNWSVTPDSYYWQAQGYRYGAERTVEYVSAVFSFTLERGHFLWMGDALGYVRLTLRDRFGVVYQRGEDKRIRGCSRRSARRIRCSRVSWTKGRFSFVGRVTVWSIPGGLADARWSKSYRIRRYDTECLRRSDRGERRRAGKSCVRIYEG